MKKQTAVEWLFDQYKLIGMLTTAQVEKAKAMEKEQILKAYRNGRLDEQSVIDKWPDRTSLQYYNETYNTDTP